MKKKLINLKDTDFLEEEHIDTPPSEIIEENMTIDENFIKNKALIRIDLNLIQFPIFSKNTQRKINQIVKYYFNKNRDTYITISPKAGEYIPGEPEEKVFIALMQIMKEYGMPKKFVVSAKELRDKLKMNNTGRYITFIKNSLLRLSETNYNFKNTMYSSEKNGILKEEISTPILTLRIISLDLEENKVYRNSIGDKRIKELYEINITDHFYNNIIQKGYLVYNGDILLEIESSVARTIYMLVEKLRFNNLYLKLDTVFLIKRIPLKYNKNGLYKTIKTLEKAFQELLKRNLISNFKIIKESTWEKSEVEIFFDESSNEDKQSRFYKDRNDFRKILSLSGVSETEHKMIEEVEVIDINKSIKVTLEMIDQILELMPIKAKSLKTLPKAIKESIEKYGYSKVEAVANYMKKNKVEKIRAYFIKALENNWVEDEEKLLGLHKTRLKIDVVENTTASIPKYNESLYTKFEKLPIEIQNGIETYVYREYIQKCGIETKVQKLAFTASRKKHICEFLEKHSEILKDNVEDLEEKNKIQPEIKEGIIENIEEIKIIITESIELADMAFSYSEEEKKRLILNILKEVIPLRNTKVLTLEKLNKIIDSYITI
ncbi:hypothetical protein [Cetobacterium sp.]|uniref:hypothetical protein n=1 Tax=Cetobacterium sp. TaxID=2071632 RepID=UPI003F399E2B